LDTNLFHIMNFLTNLQGSEFDNQNAQEADKC